MKEILKKYFCFLNTRGKKNSRSILVMYGGTVANSLDSIPGTTWIELRALVDRSNAEAVDRYNDHRPSDN